MSKKTNNYNYDLIVIGSGAGGSAAATIAAQKGKRVAIIEQETFGGESPNWGDVPTKSLLHAAHIYSQAKDGERFGIRPSMLGYNFHALQNWKNLAIKRTGAGGNQKYYQNHGITTIKGRAHFISPQEISVSKRHISSEKFLIATGSTWENPNIVGIETIQHYTPKTILSLTRPPKSLCVIGSDSTAIELAQLYAIFGTKVCIFEIAGRILPKEDSEVSQMMHRVLTDQYGITIFTSSKVVHVQKDSLNKRITYIRGGQEHSIKVNELLVTTERQPMVDIGLENAGVDYSPKGIEVNNFLQTTNKNIFAAGDVLGRDSLTHSALLESRVAVHNMYSRNKITPDYTGTPRATFTFPGIASVGLSEDDCRRRDLNFKTGLAPLSMVGRSNTSDFKDGFVKIITDNKNAVIGATIIAPHAGEMIHELALAIKHSLTAADIANTPHAFLTWSEAIRIAASKIK